MTWLHAIVLGIVQGLTEFLPISSSAHLRIVGELIGAHDPGAAFTAITQLGTETAVVIYFWRDIVRIITKWLGALRGRCPQQDPDVRMGWMVIVGSIPIVAFGLAFEDVIDTRLRNLWFTVLLLAVVGLWMWLEDTLAKQERNLTTLTWPHALAYGFAQSLALMPGVSRSGATITSGLMMGYTREAAARYSFLLAIPAVMGSGVYKLKDIAEQSSVAWGQVIVATLVAGVVGYGVIAWLLRYISTHSFAPFVYYRLGLAGVLSILLLAGYVTA